MDPETIEGLTDLLCDLDRAGIQSLVPDGDRLRYRPRSAMTPELLARLKTHKTDLLAAMRPAVASDAVFRDPSVRGFSCTIRTANEPH
jgi:hypothetical protein